MEWLNSIARRAKALVRPALKGRDARVFEDDAYIVSYPKSGNTWVRFVVSNYLGAGNGADFESIEKHVPDIYRFTDRELSAARRPRLLKSHEPLDTRYGKLVYIYRDPRSVAISYYHHCRRKGWIDADESLDAFLARYLSGTCDSYGTWSDHVGGWLGAREGQDNFLAVRYETLFSETFETMRSIVEFLFQFVDTEQLKFALDLSSKDRVNAVAADPDKPFARSQGVSDWEKELSADQVGRIERRFGPVMVRCGYVLSSDG